MKTTFGFGLACLLIFAAAVQSNYSTSNLIESADWARQSIKTIRTIEKISTLFATAQNNLRTHLMTDQEFYREMYDQARAELEADLIMLGDMTRENPMQYSNVYRLTKLMRVKLENWDSAFDIRRKGGYEAIRARLRAPTIKNADLILFDAIAAIKIEEDRAFNARTSEANNLGRQTKLVVTWGSMLACTLILIAAILVHRDSRRRAEAEGQMDRFFNISLDLICVSGMDGFFKRLSPSFTEVLGFSLKEFYAKPILDFVHPEDIQKTKDEVARQMSGAHVISFENRFRCANGQYKTLSWKSVPIADMMYAVARDVTEQKHFEADLLRARESAHRAAKSKAAFLANMSHEIRTPLNGVVGMADLMERTNLNADQKVFMGAIRSSAQILLRIVNEILDFSKIEAGRATIEMVYFDLVHLVHDRISIAGVSAHEKGLKLETLIDPRVPKVLRGDSNKIGQVLLNLLSNSVKFTDQGKVTVSVEVRTLDSTQCWLKISVRDTGIGVSVGEQARLFEPFVQADESTARKYGGTGLGLSICKRYVEMMNGEVGIESRVGEGSVFWFTLPLEVSELTSVEPVSTRSTTKCEGRKSLRILVAEDNHINQVIVINMLKALGYSAEIADNGQVAVDRFVSLKPDLILMDQHMPVMDGIEASAEIRRLEQGQRRVPIIAFTATVIQQADRERLKPLLDDYILKPVTFDVLEAALADWESRILSKS